MKNFWGAKEIFNDKSLSDSEKVEKVLKYVEQCGGSRAVINSMKERKSDIMAVFEDFDNVEYRKLEEIEMARENGLEEGIKAGREEGQELVIEKFIASCKRKGKSKVETTNDLIDDLELSLESSQMYIDMFW